MKKMKKKKKNIFKWRAKHIKNAKESERIIIQLEWNTKRYDTLLLKYTKCERSERQMLIQLCMVWNVKNTKIALGTARLGMAVGVDILVGFVRSFGWLDGRVFFFWFLNSKNHHHHHWFSFKRHIRLCGIYRYRAMCVRTILILSTSDFLSARLFLSICMCVCVFITFELLCTT